MRRNLKYSAKKGSNSSGTNMLNVLVTGGAGYIGAHCCKALQRSGFHPIVFDNLSNGHLTNIKWGDFFEGDLADSSALDTCFGKYPIAAVLHLAAFIEVGESVTNPSKYYQNNLCSSINLFETMIRHGIYKLVFSSSAAVYGNPYQIPITEDHQQSPVNPYGRAKQMTEAVLEDYQSAYGMHTVRLRYFNAAGADPDGETGEAHNPETHIIPRILDAAMDQSLSISVFGTDYSTPDGTCIRDYIHVSDLAEAHLLALKNLLSGMPSDAFNLGQGQGYSVREVIDIAKRITDKSIRVQNAPRRVGDPAVLIASAEKAKIKLGWKPRHSSLEHIVQTAWQWHHKKALIVGASMA